MSETIELCPACGGSGTSYELYGESVGACARGCQIVLPIAAWNRLSRAAALLRAVEGLEETPGDLCISYEHRNRMMIADRARVYSHDAPPVHAGWKVYGGPSADPESGVEHGRFTALRLALIALAQRVGEEGRS